MYLAKLFQSKCIINIGFNESCYFDKTKLLIYKKSLKLYKSMSNDSPHSRVIFGSSSKLSKSKYWKKKTTELINVEEQDRKHLKNKITAGNENISWRSFKNFDNKNKRLKLKSMEKETKHKFPKISGEIDLIRLTPPILIDVDDSENDKTVINRFPDRLGTATVDASNESAMPASNTKELEDFLVIDTLPSPILIDIDLPKYKKNRKSNHSDKIDYKIHKKKLFGSEKKNSNQYSSSSDHLQSVIVIDIDEPPVKCENNTTDETHKSYQSSITPNKSRVCKSVACDSNKKTTYKAHKLINNNNESEDNDDVIYETTVDKVNRSFLPLKVEKKSNFFRNHLLQSSMMYQKRKYSTGTTTDRKKISKGNKYKEIKNSPDSTSINEVNQTLSNYDDQDVQSNGDKSVLLIDEKSDIAKSSDYPLFNIDNSDIVLDNSNTEKSYDVSNVKSEVKCQVDSDFTGEIIKVNEIKENSEDSIQSTVYEDYKNTSMDLESETSDEDKDNVIDVRSSDFIPLSTFKVRDLEMCPPISDYIKYKRFKLESLRKWELTRLGQNMIGISQYRKGTLFTLLSYNILSQQLLWDNQTLYQNCNPKCLEWAYRWPLFQHEIRHLQPDIIALQEIQGDHYHTHYLPWFKHLGYNCIFKKKTREKVDGCAIIYNAKKFDLIEENSVEYYQPQGDRVLDRDNVGLIVRLTPTSYYSPFCVATTHILFNPRRTDVKLAQMTVFLAELDRICYITEEKGCPKYCPVILTGDFNSEPYSPLLELVRRGSLKFAGIQKIKNTSIVFGTELIPPVLGVSDYCQHKVLDNGRYLEKQRGELFSLKDKRKIEEQLIKLFHSDRTSSTNNEPSSSSRTNIGSVSSGTLYHAFNFKSVHYHKLNRLNGAPEVTTFQNYWATVDYIFYSRLWRESKPVEGPLKLIARYGLLGAKEAMEIGPLPSDICPSDHYPLAAQFLLKHD